MKTWYSTILKIIEIDVFSGSRYQLNSHTFLNLNMK